VPPLAGAPPTLELHFVTNDLWLETNLTWNSQPPMGQTLASWPMSTNGLDRVDVAPVASSEANGDGRLSLGLLIADPFSDTVYSFYSREAPPGVGPQLVLEKTNAALSFNDWIAGFTNVLPSERAPQGDPDGDRLNNAEEYLFARDPSLADPSPPLTVATTIGGLLFEFPQRKHLPAQTYYVIETTPSLSPATWQPAAGIEFNRTGDLGDSYLMNAHIPATGAMQSFYRFRIVLGP